MSKDLELTKYTELGIKTSREKRDR